jgi:serine/threonine protein kinase
VLKQSNETGIMVALANDEQDDDRRVVVKRWECTDEPMGQRARDVAYYERATEPFARLKHPLLPQIQDRFAEGRHYYLVETYIDGETVGERLEKLLRPLTEREVLGYINSLLNVLIVLEQQKPSLRHYDITPANIVIDAARGRAILTGFQVPAPPPPPHPNVRSERFRKRTTRKLVISPYLPIQDKPFDQRTCIYSLAASMHHALTNMAPPHYPAYPSVRLLNPAISSGLNIILSRALLEDSNGRYQTYEAMRADIQKLL